MKSPKILQKLKEKMSGKFSISALNIRQKIILLLIFSLCLFLVLLKFILPVFLPDEDSSARKVQKQQQEVKPKTETVKVVTANRDISPRTIIREDMLTTADIPKNLLPEGYVTDSKQAVNLPAAVALQKGDVLTTKKFYADIRMAGFPGRIPDDCRAVSIGISDITGVAGFAKPGDYVDIMSISGRRGSKNMSAKILLQNVLLLGINKSAKVEQPTTTAPSTSKDGKKDQSEGEGSSDDKDKDKKKKDAAEPGSTASAQAMANATVAVSPSDALKLAAAAQTGTLYLALRPVVPKETVVLDMEYVVEGGNNEEDSNSSESASAPAPTSTPSASVPLPGGDVAAQVPAAAVPPLPDPDEVTVEIIRGTQAQSTTVRSE